MKEIAKLLNSLSIPDSSNISMSTDGFAVWFTWSGVLDPSVAQIFQDYGGLVVKQNSEQGLWFFFTSDLLLALARLFIWVKFNPLIMSIQTFPAMLIVDVQKHLSLKIDEVLSKQALEPPAQGLFTLIHPRLQEIGKNIPGLTFEAKEHIEELALPDFHNIAQIEWFKFSADTRLPYTSSQGWYAILHPLGSPLDKKFQYGWRAMFTEIEQILQKLKLKYSIHDNFLMVPIDNLGQLRSWIKDVIEASFYAKENMPENYWPCVSAVVDRKGLNFNNELPHKIPIKWDSLTPDVPYMNYRNAYLLGTEFMIHDMFFVAGTSSIDNWCTVNLEELSVYADRLSVLLPGKFVSGAEHPCFYCGIASHDSAQCPTKKLTEASTSFWIDSNDLDIEEMNTALRNIEIRLTQKGHAEYINMIKERGLEARLLDAVFNINPMIQLRSVERVWLLSGKNILAPIDDTPYVEDSPCWGFLERMRTMGPGELSLFEKDVTQATTRYPRDWRLKSLLGFIAIEKNDYSKALQHWKFAESHSTSVLHQAWHYYLQGRVCELQHHYNEALEFYENVRKLLPDWYDPIYRALVCRVKMGFADQVQSQFVEMVRKRPEYFNRIIIDPELERGQMPILTALSPLWADSLKQASSEKESLQARLDELNQWFDQDHEEAKHIRAKFEALMHSLEVRNYLACQNTVRTRPQIEIEFNALRDKEITILKERFKSFLNTLELIRDEASWFPFPKTLIDFNKDFNECASILNWAFSANFHTAESFRRAKGHIAVIMELLTKLEGKLRIIRTVRDGTLFMLILGKAFFWLEVIGLILCAVTVTVVTLYGHAIGFAWLQKLITQNFWELQKVLVGVLSVTALGLAALRTTLVFEKKRERMIENAKSEREAMQQRRLNRIKENQRRVAEAGPPKQDSEEQNTSETTENLINS